MASPSKTIQTKNFSIANAEFDQNVNNQCVLSYKLETTVSGSSENELFLQVFDQSLCNNVVISRKREGTLDVSTWRKTSINKRTCDNMKHFSRIYRKRVVVLCYSFTVVAGSIPSLAFAQNNCSLTVVPVRTVHDKCMGIPHLHLLSNCLTDDDVPITENANEIELPLIPVNITGNLQGSMLSVSLIDYSIVIISVFLSENKLVVELVRRIETTSLFLNSGVDTNIHSPSDFSYSFMFAFSKVNTRTVTALTYPGLQNESENGHTNLYVQGGRIELARSGILQNTNPKSKFKVKSLVKQCSLSPVTELMLAILCSNGDVILATNVFEKNKNVELRYARDRLVKPAHICWHPLETSLVAFASPSICKKDSIEFIVRFGHVIIYDLALQPLHVCQYTANLEVLSQSLFFSSIKEDHFDHNLHESKPTKIKYLEESLKILDSSWIGCENSLNTIVLTCRHKAGKGSFIIPFPIGSLLCQIYFCSKMDVRSLVQIHLCKRDTDGFAHGIVLAGNFILGLLQLPVHDSNESFTCASLVLRAASGEIESEENSEKRNQLQYICRMLLKSIRERFLGHRMDYSEHIEDSIEDDINDYDLKNFIQRHSLDSPALQRNGRENLVEAMERRYFSQLLRFGHLEAACQFAQSFANRKLHKQSYIMYNEIAMWSKLWQQSHCEKLSLIAYRQEKEHYQNQIKSASLLETQSIESESDLSSFMSTSNISRVSETSASHSYMSDDMSDTIRLQEQNRSSEFCGLIDLDDIAKRLEDIGTENTKSFYNQIIKISSTWEDYRRSESNDASPLSPGDALLLGAWFEMEGRLSEASIIYSQHGLWRENERVKAVHIATNNSSLIPNVSFI